MTKKKAKTRALRAMTKKQQSRAAREAKLNRWILVGIIVVGVAVVGILGYGLLSEIVLKGREPVAVVGSTPISTADFVARVKLRRAGIARELYNYRAQLSLMDPTDPSVAPYLEQLNQLIRQDEAQLEPDQAIAIGQQVLDEMVQEEIIRQEAERRGLTVSEEEIDRALEQQFGYDRDAEAASPPPATGPFTDTTSETSAPVTREEFEQRYQNYVESELKPSGVSEEQFRALIEVSLLYEQVRDAIVASVPETMEQVDIRFISSTSQDAIDQIAARLDAGELWDDIVAEIEADEESDLRSSAPGWQTTGTLENQLGVEMAGVIFATPVGSYTQPLLGSNGGYYIVQVQAHEEHELEGLVLAFEQNRVFQDWFNQQHQLVEYSDNWQEKVPTEP